MLTKECTQCGTTFAKPYTCGLPAWGRRKFCSPICKKRSQIGQPSRRKGIRSTVPSRAQHILCRWCGGPTKYLGGSLTSPRTGKLRCDREECIAASVANRGAHISAAQARNWASGTRKKGKSGWRNIPRISYEENLLRPWFESIGWVAQHRVNTGVHTYKLPRQFRLDFAQPAAKLYVEIDGSTHRLRPERDARRDQMLDAIGWRGIRIPSRAVLENIESVKHSIHRFVDDASISS